MTMTIIMTTTGREGMGVCVYCSHNNNMYEGEWHRGREHGKGVMMNAQRDVIYDGEWADGKIQGHGTFYFRSKGDMYTGPCCAVWVRLCASASVCLCGCLLH